MREQKMARKCVIIYWLMETTLIQMESLLTMKCRWMGVCIWEAIS